MKIFVLTKNRGHFWTPFWSKIRPFLLKNQVFGHFVLMRTSDLSKTWSETWDNCFESSNDSVVPGKILVLAVSASYVSKIHCLWWHMVLGCFWSFSSKLLMFLVIFCYLNYVYGLGMINQKLSFNKNLGHMGQLNRARLLYIIIFKALKLAAAVFMYFFGLSALAGRPMDSRSSVRASHHI